MRAWIVAPIIWGFAATGGFAQQEPPRHTYAPGTTVRAEFTLEERTREGGRVTPFFSSYRPNVAIDGGATVICRFETEAEGGHKPGTTGEIGMSCPVPMTEGQTFRAYERRRPIGGGVVLPPVERP